MLLKIVTHTQEACGSDVGRTVRPQEAAILQLDRVELVGNKAFCTQRQTVVSVNLDTEKLSCRITKFTTEGGRSSCRSQQQPSASCSGDLPLV